jgi:general nucleoside transport system ATP-binding protein
LIEPLLSVENVSKRFGAVLALDRISAEFFPGEIHAVLGENGAGKSTLMAILAGFVRPDSGSVRLASSREEFPFDQPFAVKKLGIEMVHQHFMLVPEFTVAENLALYRTEKLLSRAEIESKARVALEVGKSLGWEIDPSARTGDLPVGTQQRVEILKALSGDAPILILDEPTAVLSPDEVEDLFRVLRQLKARGKTILLIAHKLREVMAIADRATVLRRGKFIATALLNEVTSNQLAEWMVGELPAPAPRTPREMGDVAVETRNLSVRGERGELAVNNVSVSIRRGEIVGFGGVDGNGQVELAEALAGVRNLEGYLIFSGTKPAYIPQDRQQDGLALTLSIFDNLLISGYEAQEFRKGPLLKVNALREWANELVARYQIKIGAISDPVRSLSGGNQQKVVVSRNLYSRNDVIVAVNPTRGLDLKATAFVHDALREAASKGAAVALFSTDLDELAELADTTWFMSKGRLVAGDSAAGLVGA